MIPLNLRSEASANTIPQAAQKEQQGPSARNEGQAWTKGGWRVVIQRMSDD